MIRHVAESPSGPTVLELVPGEHYVVFFRVADGDLPDEDAVEELKILAHAELGKEVLGPAETQAVISLAEAVAGGLITNGLWAQCQAAASFVAKRRAAKKAKTVHNAADAARLAVEAIRSPEVPVSAPPPGVFVSVKAASDALPWEISCQSGGAPVRVHAEQSGAIIDIVIGPAATKGTSDGSTDASARPAQPVVVL